ncbi:3-deoxy-D-manno-octulosonic acid kinase [Colwellia sp. PAMC 21821]|uniref:3-deoxy-D-manno-octulosonic acid kinase n=1 Tax=Colwellia sp. PAMC 21821 TaxID=1816219 RepID=UPI001E2E2184|nr:3-deoxy-D-manno-octulosonic acid kinase [Colwellia sp. PAMC 21821]
MNKPAIVKPCNEKTFQQGNVYCRYDSDDVSVFAPEMLNGDYWQAKNAIVGSAQGRGTTWFIATENAAGILQNWVLRHYYRGGLIGKVVNDHYIYTGIEKTRSAREFDLLKTMRALDLPAPKPIAFRVSKHGLFYRADLLSSRIQNATDLVGILSKQEIDEQLWQKIGQVIKTFHQQGIYHHDLNAHNILIDDKDKVWLIDFDQGEQRNNQIKWPEKNMARLLRSFRKESHKITDFQWREKNWQALLNGYQS